MKFKFPSSEVSELDHLPARKSTMAVALHTLRGRLSQHTKPPGCRVWCRAARAQELELVRSHHPQLQAQTDYSTGSLCLNKEGGVESHIYASQFDGIISLEIRD